MGSCLAERVVGMVVGGWAVVARRGTVGGGAVMGEGVGSVVIVARLDFASAVVAR